MGGACDKAFTAETFEEIAQVSQQHNMEMAAQQEPSHMAVLETFKLQMNNPASMVQWIEGLQAKFNALPDNQ